MSGVPLALKAADVSDLPPLSSVTDDRTRVLWILAAAEKAGQPMLTASEISDVLREVYKVWLPRQKVQALLAAEEGTVARRRKRKVRAYQLMQKGADELAAPAATAVVLVEPEQAFSRVRETKEILAGMRGTLRVCDPYVDGRTLDFLAVCRNATAIRLLTINIGKLNSFRRDLAAFNQEYQGNLEARIAAQQDLHDRYIIHDDGMLTLGTSLNGLGRKQSFVVALGPDIRTAVLARFERRWVAGTPV